MVKLMFVNSELLLSYILYYSVGPGSCFLRISDSWEMHKTMLKKKQILGSS